MSLGICCQWLESRTKRDGTIVYENIINEKLLQLGAYKDGKYDRTRILDTYRGNVKEILRIIPKLIEHNIKSFRLSSSLFPLYEFCGDIARNDEQVKNDLAIAGRLFKTAGIRVTCHPGQFTVISSDKDSVVQNSIKELEYHAWVFDMMGFDQTPYYAINIHGGKSDRSERIVDVFSTLPANVKNRLTLENDEKCYNVSQLLEISNKTGIPVVFDSHHYRFNDNDIDFDSAFSECCKTWGAITPLQHISNTEAGKENGSFNERRSHSDYITSVPELQLFAVRENKIDLDVEAKMKNFALLKMRKEFEINA
jgi:UV DNA damage endonuclease